MTVENLTRSANSCVIHDYLTFSGTPEPIQRIKAVAKVGGLVKSDIENSQSFPEIEREFRSKAELASMLDGIQVVAAGHMTFNECYQAILEKTGLAFMDSVCRGDVFVLVQKLNDMDRIKGANRWTIEDCNHGMFGYSHSANLLCDGAMAGKACWGAKNFGYMLSFTGAGCVALDMKKMHSVLTATPGLKITRVDLAYDDFEGDFNINITRKMAQRNLFKIGNNNKLKYKYYEGGGFVKQANGRWKEDASGGRSYYIGRRESGKMFRHYEKGKQLGCDKYPNWTRAEVELRSVDRVIPFEVLLEPDKYLAATYPCLAFISKEAKKIETFKRKYKVTINKAFDAAAKQVGRLANFAVNHWGMSSEELVTRLTKHLDINDLPERLILPVPAEEGPSQMVETLAGPKHWDCSTDEVERLLKDNFDNRPNDRGIQPCLS